MKKYLKLPITLAAFALTCSFGYAEETNEIAVHSNTPDSFQSKNIKKEEKPSAEPQKAGYNAPARIDVIKGYDAYITAGFLYWQPLERGLNIGNYSATYGNASSVKMDFDFHPAFKVGMGMGFNPDNWESGLEYTRFHSKDSNKKVKNEGDYEYGLVWDWYDSNLSDVAAVEPNEANSIKAKWKLKTDILDLAFTRPYYLGKKLIFKPFYGLRGGWIDQKYDSTATFSVLEEYLEVTANVSSDSWFIGPRAGLNSNWCFDYGLSAFGNVAAAF